MATGTDPRRNFTPRLLPWLLAATAFVFFIITLNHWVSLLNLVAVAKISGWTWQPETQSPLLYLITYPFRWLPAAAVPVALNLFSALCAALTMGLLARSIVILPHDRTEEQRRRERNDFSFLTIRLAWLPPLFAVVALGLELTFWQRATNFTGDMFDLMIFAFVVWSLLEYRLDEREGRLFLAALVYGAGMAENFAMVGFLPVFVTAIVWIRGLTFFNTRFIVKMALFGLIGTSLYLVFPLLIAASPQVPISFWQSLKSEIVTPWAMAKLLGNADVRHTLAILAVPSLLPVLFAAIRWPSSFGDSSPLGMILATWMFHLFHALILFVCVWVMFDPPFSPVHEGYGMPCLPFYYLTALSIGYFTGYFLLAFRHEINSRRRGVIESETLHTIAVAITVVFVVVASVGLLYKNLPAVRTVNHSALGSYTALVERNLPGKAVLLCDSDNPAQDAPWRLFAVQAALARDGKSDNYVPVDTKALNWSAYLRYLHRKYPHVWPQIVGDKDIGAVNPHVLPTAIALIAKSNQVYYLHPSIGYYFEQFYAEPHGAVYKMNLLPDGELVPPTVDKSLIAENNGFWSKAEETFSALEKHITLPDPATATNLSIGEKVFMRFHIAQEPDPDSVLVGGYLSCDLDFWGVALQRAGELEKASDAFATAQLLNPENAVAAINADFNETLRAGHPKPAELTDTVPNQLVGGPIDEPSHCFEAASIYIGNGYYKQAIANFERVRALAPDNLASRFMLAQLYIMFRKPEGALAALQEPMAHPEKFSLGPDNSTQLNVLAAESYFLKGDLSQGARLLNQEINKHPNDTNLITASVQAFLIQGLYSDALNVLNRKLAANPDDALWLFGKGYVELQMKNYDASIAALTRVLQLQTNNNEALYNRAYAYLKSGRYDEARADYLRLQEVVTNSPQIAYGLGEIAWNKHQTNEAIRNYEIYLAAANTNFAEAREVAEHLKALKR